MRRLELQGVGVFVLFMGCVNWFLSFSHISSSSSEGRLGAARLSKGEQSLGQGTMWLLSREGEDNWKASKRQESHRSGNLQRSRDEISLALFSTTLVLAFTDKTYPLFAGCGTDSSCCCARM